MALHFAFHVGSLAFVTTLVRCIWEGAAFSSGLTNSAITGLVFFGIGFAIGEISRHMMEELAARELAALSDLQEAEQHGLKSSAGSTGQ